MNTKQMAKKLEKIQTALDKIATDVEELADIGAQFQAERIRKQAAKVGGASTQIHGSGTGND